MKKIDLIREFKEAAGLANQKDAKEILEVLGNIIVAHMKDEDGITPFAGMKFSSVYKEARTMRNPATGEPVEVAPKYSPKVKFGKTVKEALN